MNTIHYEKNILVSAILMSYNQKDFVLLHLENILAQDFRGHMEIIITDDASTDGTVEAIEVYLSNKPSKFPVLINRNERNLGIGGNLQRGVDISHGKYIIKFDGDDLSSVSRVSMMMDVINKHPGYLLYCNDFDDLDEFGNVHVRPSQRGDFSTYTTKWNSHEIGDGGSKACGCVCCYDRILFTSFQRINERAFDDTVLEYRAKLLGSKIFFYHMKLTFYRSHSNNIVNSTNNDKNQKARKHRVGYAISLSNVISDCVYLYSLNKISYQQYSCILKLLQAEQRFSLAIVEAKASRNFVSVLDLIFAAWKCRRKKVFCSLVTMPFLLVNYVKRTLL